MSMTPNSELGSELNWVQTKSEWLEQYHPGRMQVFHTWASTENGTRGGFRSQVRN